MTHTTWEERFDKGVSNLLDNTSERDRDIYFAFKDFITTEIERAKREVVEYLKSRGEEAVQGLWYISDSNFEKALQAPDLSDKE